VTPEGAILRLIQDWLTAKSILHFRMQTGALPVGKRFVRFGTPGCADLLAFPVGQVTWIECKTPTGRQSELQKSFQVLVERHGHRYLLARSLDDVIASFRTP